MIKLLEGIPSSWGKATIGEIALVHGGKPAPQERSAFAANGIPFVRMKDLGRYHLTDNLDKVEDYLDPDFAASHGLTPIRAGAILMPRSGSVALNHRAILGVDAVIVSHICAIEVTDPNVSNEFLYRYLSRIRMDKITKKTTGLDAINFSDLRQIQIPIPPIAEQRRIAAILDKADSIRRKRESALVMADELLESVFVEMFLRDGQVWPRVSLRSVAELINGDRSSNYPSGKDIVSEGVIFLSTKNIDESELAFENSVFITEEKFASLSRGKLKRNDLVITLRGSIGQCAIFDCEYETGFINAQMMIIRPSSKVLPNYLHRLIIHPIVQNKLASTKSGSAVPQLTAKQIADLEIPLPPLEAQKEFTYLSSAVSRQQRRQRQSLQASEELFGSLSQRAFRGAL